MPDFDVQKFKEAVFKKEMFSVPTFSEKGVKEVQEKDDVDVKTTSRGRIWRNIRDAVSSKVNRIFNAPPEIRKTLVGDAKKKISNENILKHIYDNVTNVSKYEDLEKLKTTLAALRGFGADPIQCKTVEDEINIQIRKAVGPKNKKDMNVAEQLMKVNLGNALYEHLIGTAKQEEGAFVTSSELETIQSSESAPKKLVFTFGQNTAMPVGRNKNEDVQFVKSIEIQVENQVGLKEKIQVGYLVGVLDGHGGKDFALYAKDYFKSIFVKELEASKRNVLIAFEKTFAKVQNKLADKTGGSTAVISYVDKQTNKVYTATLGNSQAMVCRKVEGKWRLIPLSPIQTNRSLGVSEYSNEEASQKPEEDSQKPEVTVFQLMPGDRFFLASDGVTDYLKAENIAALLQDDKPPQDFAQSLVATALEKMRKTSRTHKPLDDASVVTFTVESAA